MITLLKLLCVTIAFIAVSGFQPAPRPRQHQKVLNMGEEKGFFSEFMENVDAAIDDFMNKRMGNGEVFYGKRKYKPSGRSNTEGRYNGMGLSDKARIDFSREKRESVLEARRQRQEREN